MVLVLDPPYLGKRFASHYVQGLGKLKHLQVAALIRGEYPKRFKNLISLHLT